MGVEAEPALGLSAAVNAIAIELSRPDIVQIAVPDILSSLRQGDAFDFAAAVAIEEAELDLLGGRGKQREVRSSPIPSRPQGIGQAARQAHSYDSGTRKIAARGGTTRLTSGIIPLSNVVTTPPFPILLPP